jgi:hypothetical protein
MPTFFHLFAAIPCANCALIQFPKDCRQTVACSDEVPAVVTGLVGVRIEMGQKTTIGAAGFNNPVARSRHESTLIWSV